MHPLAGGEQMPGRTGLLVAAPPTSVGLGDRHNVSHRTLARASVRHPSPASTSFVLGLTACGRSTLTPAPWRRAPSTSHPASKSTGLSAGIRLADGETALDKNRSFTDADLARRRRRRRCGSVAMFGRVPDGTSGTVVPPTLARVLGHARDARSMPVEPLARGSVLEGHRSARSLMFDAGRWCHHAEQFGTTGACSTGSVPRLSSNPIRWRACD